MIAPKRPHVLYVEDDDDSCQMMTILLDTSGIDVTCVRGMADTVRLPDKYRFDLFLLDLWLNDGDGSDLCVKLRTEFPNIPVVFYTGCATERERKQGLVAGAAAYLIKPYSELIAPTVLKLVAGEYAVHLFGRPIDRLVRLKHDAVKLSYLVKGADLAMPLSP